MHMYIYMYIYIYGENIFPMDLDILHMWYTCVYTYIMY